MDVFSSVRPGSTRKYFGLFFSQRPGSTRTYFGFFLAFGPYNILAEDGSDWAENLTKSISDDIAKNMFLDRSKNTGVTFRIFPIFWKVVYPPGMAPIGLKI